MRQDSRALLRNLDILGQLDVSCRCLLPAWSRQLVWTETDRSSFHARHNNLDVFTFFLFLVRSARVLELGERVWYPEEAIRNARTQKVRENNIRYNKFFLLPSLSKLLIAQDNKLDK